MTNTAQIERIHRCTKHPEKVQYRTTDDAFNAADRRAPQEGVPIYVYACDHCGYFHLSKKRGTEDIGRMLDSRAAGLVWETATANPRNADVVRDERFVDPSPQAKLHARIAAAIRDHGNPDTLKARQVMTWLGYADRPANSWAAIKVREGLTALGWKPTGIKAGQVWHRQIDTVTDVVVPESEPAPLALVTTTPVDVDSPWVVLDHASIGFLTLDQLSAAYSAAGFTLRVMVRRDS